MLFREHGLAPTFLYLTFTRYYLLRHTASVVTLEGSYPSLFGEDLVLNAPEVCEKPNADSHLDPKGPQDQ
jgi:hypothetical protein